MHLTAQHSTLGHLFHFYPLLLEIATLPNKPPTLWMMPALNDLGETITIQAETPLKDDEEEHEASSSSLAHVGTSLGGKVEPVEVDSRRLAGECLRILGKEFGR